MGNDGVFEDWDERQGKGKVADGWVRFCKRKPYVRRDHGQKCVSRGFGRLVVEFEEPQGEGDDENYREEVEYAHVEGREEIEHLGEDIPP